MVALISLFVSVAISPPLSLFFPKPFLILLHPFLLPPLPLSLSLSHTHLSTLYRAGGEWG